MSAQDPGGQLASLLGKETIRDVILTTAQALDEGDMAVWLDQLSDDGVYEITAFGPEIKSDMVWWHSSRIELVKILYEVEGHIRDAGIRRHLVTPISITLCGWQADALSHFSIIRTTPAGDSGVYAAGRYEDKLINQNGKWKYALHKVVLDTRMFETFTHIPL
jgi:3-phenylpropionate/cinnamic acid dioxygenase small subunit